ncbi:DUF599 domain-containing protein [Profundibacterium mesophilum]|uniref:Membrane protein n=1 Tax=Profundibacterium mesophilum KAUST100406-0324 TaxID=1037889 RepID=A0A921NSF3_9RHOB|nr:DUF599 domain-containing protein [Profundibacterium mesophilum]KAF0674545.1 putative membrane protein [Profundibacterium mesophilum KAUST100406-0324]
MMGADLLGQLALFPILDRIAVIFLLASTFTVGWLIERPSGRHPSVTVRMADFRREWMRQLVTRQPRIFDASVLGTLRQGTSFFASTCVIAIGGVLALMGNSERLAGLAIDLNGSRVPPLVWQAKLGLVALLLTAGFLKFVWANRLFGYCAVVMAAVPNDADDAMAYPRAAQAAEINIRAAWNFNRGLRWMYFALAALAWLAGALPMIAATMVTFWTLWSREFLSNSHRILTAPPPRGP